MGAVAQLEAEVAGLLGKPAAVMFPSGVMAQQATLRAWCDRSGSRRVALPDLSHLVHHEQDGPRRVLGLELEWLTTGRETPTAEALARVGGRLGAAMVELPLRDAGCLLPTWDELVALSTAARERGVPLHADGARIWESVPHWDRTLAEVGELFDSVYVSLYKGLGASSGALVVCPEDLAGELRSWRQRMGGTLFSMTTAAVGGLMGLRDLSRFGDHRAWAIALAAALRDHGFAHLPRGAAHRDLPGLRPRHRRRGQRAGRRLHRGARSRAVRAVAGGRRPGLGRDRADLLRIRDHPRPGRGGWFDGRGSRGESPRHVAERGRIAMRAEAGTTLGGCVRRGAALALLACGTALSVTAPAHAAGELCDSGVVFDEADVLDDRAVSRAARSSFDDRVTVKVIAWEQTPGGGTLYDALVDARTQCAGWGFAGGGRRSLLVLGVSTGGRELGTHYDGWAFDRFDASRDDVETGAMGPAFGNGQWTDGMVEGLRGYAEAYAASSPTRGPEPYVPEIDDFSDDFSSDGGGSAPSPWLLGVPVGLAAVGGGGYGAVRLRRRLKARAAARASLAHGVSAMAQAWFELDESNELIDARVGALPPVSDSVADGIRTAHTEAVATRDAATATYLRLSEVHTETAVAGMDTEEATRAGHEVEAATRELRDAQAAMAVVEERLSAYDTLREELPARIDALRAGATEVTALLASRQVEGYRTTDNDAAPAAAEGAATRCRSTRRPAAPR